MLGGLGETKRVGLVAVDKAANAFASVVPFPNRANDAGCILEATIVTPKSDSDKPNRGGGGGFLEKTYRYRDIPCEKNAAGIIKAVEKAVEANFSAFGNFSGSFTTPVGTAEASTTFASGLVTQGKSIDITQSISISGLSRTISTGVTVEIDSLTQFGFITQSTHPIYPGSITFNAVDSGKGTISFSIYANGYFSSVFTKLAFKYGGEDVENAIWDNFIAKIREECNKKP